MQANDIEALAAMLADDWKITMHSSGKVLSKDEWVANFGTAINLLKAERARCIYENAEICVQHSFVKFPSGATDAVMYVVTLKDGLGLHTETGDRPTAH